MLLSTVIMYLNRSSLCKTTCSNSNENYEALRTEFVINDSLKVLWEVVKFVDVGFWSMPNEKGAFPVYISGNFCILQALNYL